MILIVSVLLCVLTCAAARSADTTALPREQATRLLDTLKDPAKREQFTATLDAYVKSLPPEAPAASASGRYQPGRADGHDGQEDAQLERA